MAHRCATRLSPLRDERGFTIIELAIAVLIVTVGLAAVAVGFVGPQKLSQAAQRESQAAQIAEADIESIIGRPYANIAVTPLPSHAEDSYPSDPGYTPNPNNPSNPLYYVNDPAFYKSGCEGTTFPALKNHYNAGEGQLIQAEKQDPCGEHLVPAKAEAEGGIPFEVSTTSEYAQKYLGIAPNAPAGTVYNFITWHHELCIAKPPGGGSNPPPQTLVEEIVKMLEEDGETVQGLINNLFGSENKAPPPDPLCSSTTENDKRVTVVVVLNQPGSKPGLTKPLYVSTLVPDPKAGAPAPTLQKCTDNIKALFGC